MKSVLPLLSLFGLRLSTVAKIMQRILNGLENYSLSALLNGVIFLAKNPNFEGIYKTPLQVCFLCSSEKNRYQNALSACNAALDSVVFDIFWRPSTSILDYLHTKSCNSTNREDISSRLLKSLKR